MDTVNWNEYASGKWSVGIRSCLFFGHLTTQSFSPIMRSAFILSICLEVFPEEKAWSKWSTFFIETNCVNTTVCCALCTAFNISINSTVKIHWISIELQGIRDKEHICFSLFSWHWIVCIGSGVDNWMLTSLLRVTSAIFDVWRRTTETTNDKRPLF